MKMYVLLVVIAALLCGCGQVQTMETVDDTLVEPVMAEPREVYVELPGEAAVPAMESDSSRFYLCQDYEIAIETRQSGDLASTIRTLTGYEPEELTVMERELDGVKRYDFVWASAGEMGERLGRAVILDDGNYHYSMSVLRDADTTETLQVVWHQVFSSFTLA